MSSTFCSTWSLKHYYISRDNEYFSTDSSNSYLMSFDKTILYKGPIFEIQHIPSTVKFIVTHYSYGCSLQGISFEGSSLEEIQNSAFVSEKLDLFEPPNTLIRINNNFFEGPIKTLVIPDSVVFLHRDALASITMEELEFGPDSKVLVNVSGVIYDKNKTIIHFIPSTIDRIEISEKLASISKKNIVAHNIKWVEVDNKSETFSSYEGVLYNQNQSILVACPGGLESVILSPKCKTIDNEAFLECLVSKIELNEGLENINPNAFGNCLGLIEMAVPGTVKNLGNWAFNGCKKLKFLNSFSSNLSKISSDCFYDAILGTVDFSQCNFTLIPAECFYASKISTIIFPSKLTRIDSSSFANCKFLENVTFPSCVEFIGEKSFKDCISLKNIIFQGELLQSIERSAFEHIDVETINIPSYVKSISPGAFRNCVKLNKVIFKDNSTLNSIGFDIINGCKTLQEFVIPKSVRFKGQSLLSYIDDSAFEGCVSLDYINLVNISNIGAKAFYNCQSLTSFTLPKSILYVGPLAFGNCSSLVHLNICSRNNNLIFSPDCFFGSKLVEIYVPFEYGPGQINSIPVIRILDDNCNFPTLQFSQIIGYGNISLVSAACLSCISEGGKLNL